MKKSSILILALLLSGCSSTPGEGHWVPGANKMHVYVPKKVKKECKLELGWRGAGLRETYGYQQVCKPIKSEEKSQ